VDVKYTDLRVILQFIISRISICETTNECSDVTSCKINDTKITLILLSL